MCGQNVDTSEDLQKHKEQVHATGGGLQRREAGPRRGRSGRVRGKQNPRGDALETYRMFARVP